MFLFTGTVCSEDTEEPEDTVKIEVRIYEIFGMGCPGCHGSIEKQVKKVEGVVSCEANWEKQQITVKVQEEADVPDKTIHKAIKKANFTPGKRLQ